MEASRTMVISLLSLMGLALTNVRTRNVKSLTKLLHTPLRKSGLIWKKCRKFVNVVTRDWRMVTRFLVPDGQPIPKWAPDTDCSIDECDCTKYSSTENS
jgi:hypothetical protein